MAVCELHIKYFFVIIIIIIIIIISFMQGIYASTPATNYVPGEKCCSYSVVAIHGAYIVSFSVESIVKR